MKMDRGLGFVFLWGWWVEVLYILGGGSGFVWISWFLRLRTDGV